MLVSSANKVASQILRELSNTRRRIVADWRIEILHRRLAMAENSPIPDVRKVATVRDELLRRGDMRVVEGVSGVYLVDVPYANILEISEEQIVQEANPWAVFGFSTALVYHGLTDLLSDQLYPIVGPHPGRSGRLPLGTTAEDWSDDAEAPPARQPTMIGRVPIAWTKLSEEPTWGIIVAQSFGVPIYMTDPERTLIDALRMPGKSGGISKVLQAWRDAEGLDLERLVSHVDAYNNKVHRQRVGYLLGRLGLAHPRLDRWKEDLQRGGSVKLVAGDSYSGVYADEWNLSLNVPGSVLGILDAS